MSQTKAAGHKLQVYFDGLCPLCSREIDVYRKKDKAGAIEFVDISHPEFTAEKEGLHPRRVQEVFHVRETASGKLLTGVDGFIAIWKVLPGLGLAARVAEKPWAKPFLKAGYCVFAKIRPYLPKRAPVMEACDSGQCVRKQDL